MLQDKLEVKKISTGMTREDDVDGVLSVIEEYLRELKKGKFFNTLPSRKIGLQIKFEVDKKHNLIVKSISSLATR